MLHSLHIHAYIRTLSTQTKREGGWIGREREGERGEREREREMAEMGETDRWESILFIMKHV